MHLKQRMRRLSDGESRYSGIAAVVLIASGVASIAVPFVFGIHDFRALAASYIPPWFGIYVLVSFVLGQPIGWYVGLQFERENSYLGRVLSAFAGLLIYGLGGYLLLHRVV